MRFSSLLPCLLGSSATAIVLVGCGSGPSLLTSLPVVSPPLSGVVHGGQQPISGAHIHVFGAVNNGYGAQAASLMTGGGNYDAYGEYVTTTSTGTFNLTGYYACTPGQNVYVLSYAGNPGLVAGTSNTSAVLVALLGPCPSDDTFAGHISSISLSELSTVAAAYALAGYSGGLEFVSSSTTTSSMTGLTSAFSSAANMVSLQNGNVYATTPAGNGVVPQTKIYTLANIVSACINSTGSTGSGNPCAKLFTAATPSGGTAPTNTFDALVNIARNPASNVSTIYKLAPTGPPYTPSLTTAPTDWTLAIQYSAPNLSAPGKIAIDASGDVWIPNAGNSSLTKLSPLGAVLSGTSGFTGGGLNKPTAIAFDSSGNLWVANSNSSAISGFKSSGTPISATGYPTGNSASTYDVAIDANTGYIWTSGDLATTAISPTGTSESKFTGIANNAAIVQGSGGTMWSVSSSANSISSFASSTAKTYTGGGLSSPSGIALDSGNNLWVSDGTASTVSAFTSSGTALTSTGYSVAGSLLTG